MICWLWPCFQGTELSKIERKFRQTFCCHNVNLSSASSVLQGHRLFAPQSWPKNRRQSYKWKMSKIGTLFTSPFWFPWSCDFWMDSIGTWKLVDLLKFVSEKTKVSASNRSVASIRWWSFCSDFSWMFWQNFTKIGLMIADRPRRSFVCFLNTCVNWVDFHLNDVSFLLFCGISQEN